MDERASDASCWSELESGRVNHLEQSEANVGLLWTSDPAGLQFDTLDYNEVFDRVDTGRPLSVAIHETLQAGYVKQLHENANADRRSRE